MANYLDISGISSALAAALKRRESRKSIFDQQAMEASQNWGKATANAVNYHQRKSAVDSYGGDPNDSELNIAKQYYLKTGDPSLISRYEDAKRQQAMQEKQLKVAMEDAVAKKKAADADAAGIKAEQERQQKIDIQSLVAPLQSALADIDVRKSRGNLGEPEGLKSIKQYNIAHDNLNAAYPDVAEKFFKMDDYGNYVNSNGVIVDKDGKVIVSTQVDGNSASEAPAPEPKKNRSNDAVKKDLDNLTGKNLTTANVNNLEAEVEAKVDDFTPAELEKARKQINDARRNIAFNKRVNDEVAEIVKKFSSDEKYNNKTAKMNKINALEKGDEYKKAVAKKLREVWGI